MNERIKELMEYAVRFRLDPDSNAYEAQVTPEDLKLFAELIVEECRYVMDCNKGSDQHSEWNQALFETSVKIKEHFGVEE